MPEELNTRGFPKDFLWGASTSSYQVEGGNHSQWSVWELQHAAQFAKMAEKRYGHLPIWPDIKKQAEKPENYISGRGVDHYKRYEEDFDLAKKLNLNAFRFGIEWSRLEPEEGKWDEEAVEHYHKYIAELKKRGITPVLNVWHWTIPVWFSDKGAFEKRANLKYFNRFVEKLAKEYGKELHYVLTLNEPNVYTSFGYLTGVWPPQDKNLWKGVKVYWYLTRVHKKAYKTFKQHNPHIQVGLAMQLGNIQAKRPHNLLDEFSTKVMRYGWNWWFLRRTRKQQDFIGFNYYFTDYYAGLFKKLNPNLPKNDMGWYMEPEGLYPLLVRIWSRYKKPIIITENGVSDMKDEYRRWWIEESLVGMQRAMSEGVVVKGYFHWSLLDNFEWADGWWPKFGLVKVHREQGMKREIRESAKWFSSVIKKLKS